LSYKIRLDIFEGPLDLLLYLIKEEELNIYNIPITRITEQYLEYMSMMEMLDLDVAGDFLVMAATLMQIKSRMLLPANPEGVAEEEEDPRAELVRRLIEYKAFKEAAEKLRGFENLRSGVFTRANVEPEVDGGDSPFLEVSLFDLMSAFQKVLKTLPVETFHDVVKDEFTVAEKVRDIFSRLTREPMIRFSALFKSAKNKIEVITVFLALLELIRMKEVRITQPSQFDDIEITRNVRPQEPAAEPEASDAEEIQGDTGGTQ
jgi:segregation and condensation protein A